MGYKIEKGFYAYNENGEWHYYETIEEHKTCKYCRNTYLQLKNEQASIFENLEEDICPYCDKVNDISMKYTFDNYKNLNS